jgi:hypothetical protein
VPAVHGFSGDDFGFEDFGAAGRLAFEVAP